MDFSEWTQYLYKFQNGRKMVKKSVLFAVLMSFSVAILAQEDNNLKVKNKNFPNLEEVIVVWKTHCDIGYTHPVPEVLDNYRGSMIDGALKLIDESSTLPPDEQFVWALPAWVMERILDEKQDSAKRVRIEKAIRDGRLIWHALPYTFESEVADVEELIRGLGSATRLSKHFGQTLPTDSKLTDVPSQAWILPSLLANAGVKFVHIGVNPWSPNPDVPNLFWWEGPDGSRVLTGYAFHQYSWNAIPPADWPYKTWLCFRVTGDNAGAPSSESVKDVLDKIQKELPGVRVRFGRPSDFADAIIQDKSANVPVIKSDMPDTWTHGQMSMPVPTKIHRNVSMVLNNLGVLNTQFRAWKVPVNNAKKVLAEAYDQSMLYAEHTWGICGPAFGTPDHATWKKELAEGKYKAPLATYEYHANYARNAFTLAQAEMDLNINALAKAVSCKNPHVVVCNPSPWMRSGIVSAEIPVGTELPCAMKDIRDESEIKVSVDGQKVSFFVKNIPPGGYCTYSCVKGQIPQNQTSDENSIETEYFKVKFDLARGGIASLVSKIDGKELVQSQNHVLGQFMHERFCKKNVDDFIKKYCHVYYDWYDVPYYDFNKPKLDSTITYARITPDNWTLLIVHESTGDRAELVTTSTQGLADKYTLNFFFPKNQACIDICWKVENKTPELIPEGGWLCLPLAINNPTFRVSRSGGPISPEKDIISGSNRHLLSIDYGISVRDSNNGKGIGVSSSDLPLWSLGEPGLWNYSIDYIPTKSELFANLYNNQWNTNYPLWVDGSWTASLRVWPIDENTSEEAALFTPSNEYRQELVSAYSNFSSNILPASKKGISLSRKGIRVTAFCENPDAEKGVSGTLVRFWEQSGISSEVVFSLPEGFKASKAQMVNLRGEKIGDVIPIKQGDLKFSIKPYSPLSFVLF
jgi:alpha-mannosidase